MRRPQLFTRTRPSARELGRPLKQTYLVDPLAACSRFIIASLLLLGPVTTNAKAAKKHLTIADLTALAIEIPANDISVPLTPEVVTWVNRLIGTPHSRRAMRESLERLRSHEIIVRKALNEAGLPSGLAAIPILESGYQNVKSRTGAGIWQLVKETGRKYGLTVPANRPKVDSKAKRNPQAKSTPAEPDERLDIEKSTRVAVALLSDLNAEFNDWHLTLIAYNIGEGALRKAIQKAKSRDAFQVIKLGGLKPSQKVYLPKVLAHILILRHPDLIAD